MQVSTTATSSRPSLSASPAPSPNPDVITIVSPYDMHLHLREDEMLKLVAPLSAGSFAGGVVMPNLVNPVDCRSRLDQYRQAVVAACQGAHPGVDQDKGYGAKGEESQDFLPLMTLFFRQYSEEELFSMKDDIFAIKLYPAGITTQSENGVSDFGSIEATLDIMERLGIPLLVHGESNGFVMDREREFISIYEWICSHFPKLHVVMEHITTSDAVDFLDKHPQVSATLTLHHLLITLDDVAGGLLQPDLFCKPIAKTPRDLERLRNAVLSGHPQIMFGSDSAPHPRHKKECCGCAAGIFTAPVALPMLAEFFEDGDRLDLLEDFVANIAIKRHGLAHRAKTVTLKRIPWKVPELYGSVKPFGAGTTLRWSCNADGKE